MIDRIDHFVRVHAWDVWTHYIDDRYALSFFRKGPDKGITLQHADHLSIGIHHREVML